ncbi:hypothetical protein [Aurantiacibacter marinus]|uniref:Transmembrane protein n=1 Tax=Aurantiacibacter marinus TaxID=874156 RepID=A0A0H0XX91_9SPHN|nr:hypothetical protein [Aurantiacibacter marinus]KLI64900.1 hypothetical protein AAV99_05200 [Aurantiacibacter marinus]
MAEVLRDGLRIWRMAPLIPALIVLPEFAQHIAEIQIGMFESRDAGVALADDPTRWAFGYIKIAGLVLAIFAAVRFWGGLRTGQRWWDLSAIGWRNVGIAIVLTVLTSLPGKLLESSIGEEKAGWIDIALGLATLPLIVLLVHGLSGNRESSLGSVFRNGWLAAIRILVFAALVWLPLQFLHSKNHDWAFGAPDALVWGLMVFDSLVVGLLATMAGTAIHHGAVPLREKIAPPVGNATADLQPI